LGKARPPYRKWVKAPLSTYPDSVLHSLKLPGKNLAAEAFKLLAV